MNLYLPETELKPGHIYAVTLNNFQIGAQTVTRVEWFHIDSLEPVAWSDEHGNERQGVVTRVAQWDNGRQVDVSLCAEPMLFWGSALGLLWNIVEYVKE